MRCAILGTLVCGLACQPPSGIEQVVITGYAPANTDTDTSGSNYADDFPPVELDVPEVTGPTSRCADLDVLFVIDNSGSMGDDQVKELRLDNYGATLVRANDSIRPMVIEEAYRTGAIVPGFPFKERDRLETGSTCTVELRLQWVRPLAAVFRRGDYLLVVLRQLVGKDELRKSLLCEGLRYADPKHSPTRGADVHAPVFLRSRDH